MYDQARAYYVYGYQRSKNSEHGIVGTYYYVGKGTRHRAFDRNHGVLRPQDPNRIVIITDHINEADALQLEMLLIHLFGRIDVGTGNLRNRTDGGEGTQGKSPEVIESIAQKHRGTKRSAEARQRMSEAATRRCSTPEYKEKFKRIMRASNTPEKIKARKPLSAESRQRMSEAAIRRCSTPEYKEKFKETMDSVRRGRRK